jgi:hypothetical protein
MNDQANYDLITYISHKKLIEQVHFELLDAVNYMDRDYYFLPNALLRKKNRIFKPNGFFSIMENSNFDNFLITRNFTHCESIKSLSALMHGVYHEITCGKTNHETFEFAYDEVDIFKWHELKTSDIIDSFLQYEFNVHTFKDFVVALFPEETDYILNY